MGAMSELVHCCFSCGSGGEEEEERGRGGGGGRKRKEGRESGRVP